MPFKIGHSFDIAPIGPRFVNWPIANSKYSNGIPQNIITRKYGIKNIPKSKYYIVKVNDCRKMFYSEENAYRYNIGIINSW